MAKKKQTKSKAKSRSRKQDVEEVVERSAFWPAAGGILLILLGLFMLLGGFGTGGPLPVNLFKGTYAVLGWAAYLAPVALVYWGVHKFNSEDRKIPLGKFVSMICVLLFAAGFLYVAFASKDTLGNWSGGHGGGAGELVGTMVLSALDKIPASLLFFIFFVLSVFFAFGISVREAVKAVWPWGKEKGEEDEETDLGTLKAKASNFQLVENVPVEHKNSKDQARMSSFKNSAAPLSANQSHEALTTASDPDWQLPGVDLLDQKQDKANAGDVNANAQTIHDTFSNFNIDVEMEGANIGPRVTQYTLKPPKGVKLTKLTALESNVALDLAATSIRMEAPIPGKQLVGIEVPNLKAATVRISSILQSQEWQQAAVNPLEFAIGKDISGKSVVGDLGKMPHLLVAGQTGSGKSVMINTILSSLLYHNSPADLKLILVDPKRVELTPYNDIPHLLTPVIVEPEKCISALKWATAEMERRYSELADAKKRNIEEYNKLKQEEGMPYIIIVIDELSDLMMMAARDVEALIVRIAQKARAVGIHLILATQRPSVDVITGLIKANVPGRIAFTTQSQVDSRTIIDQMGAEKLLGMGDMLLLTSDMPKPKRIQGAFIGDDETHKVMDFLKMQREPQYNDEVVSQPVQLNGKGGIVMDMGGDDTDEPIYRDAVRVVIEGGKASTSLLQRRLRIGYGKAARLIETMEEQGIVGASDGNRPREVLVSSLDQVFGGNSESDDALDENFPDQH
jgi:S-DNA-T family DNA segregation ATPase FtsK/SpoIIIE